MNRFLLFVVFLMVAALLAFFLLKPGLIKESVHGVLGLPGGMVFKNELPDKVETWMGSDGKSMQAILVSADDQRAEFRLPDTQRVHYLNLDALAAVDQERVRKRVSKWGKAGVLGYPVSLRADPWPKI